MAITIFFEKRKETTEEAAKTKAFFAHFSTFPRRMSDGERSQREAPFYCLVSKGQKRLQL